MWESKVKNYLECNIDFLSNMFIKDIIEMYFFPQREKEMKIVCKICFMKIRGI